MNDRPRAPRAVPMEQDSSERGADAQIPRKPAFVADMDAITRETGDPFAETDLADELADLDALTPSEVRPRRRGLSWARIALSAFGAVFSFALYLWLDSLVQAFFIRSPLLGWTVTGLIALGVLALLAIAVREIRALMRLESVQTLKSQAEKAALERNPAPARKIVTRLIRLFADHPETARGRARLADLEEQIIDGPDLIGLAETELLSPIDGKARELILAASKRVSVVTAISPRALVDLAYVLYEAIRLIRRLSYLYGGRPGTLGMMKLSRDVVGHLAVTGSLSVGDGIVQQLVGQGLANRLSAKLGEGVINGLMTARIGIAAMDLCRPLPFRATRRPGISDFVGTLTRQVTGTAGKNKTDT